jgi:acyl-CoA dehydrogenase
VTSPSSPPNGVITAAEFEVMKRRNALRDIVVHVDDFPFDYGVATANKPAESRMAA